MMNTGQRSNKTFTKLTTTYLPNQLKLQLTERCLTPSKYRTKQTLRSKMAKNGEYLKIKVRSFLMNLIDNF